MKNSHRQTRTIICDIPADGIMLETQQLRLVKGGFQTTYPSSMTEPGKEDTIRD